MRMNDFRFRSGTTKLRRSEEATSGTLHPRSELEDVNEKMAKNSLTELPVPADAAPAKLDGAPGTRPSPAA